MPYLPVMLDLEGRLALVVGGGAVALRRAGKLLEAGARVRLVAREATEELEALAARDARVTLHRRAHRDEDLDGVCLVFSATGEPEVERAVASAAAHRGLWCNAADDPANCSFLLPAVVDRGPLQVAVSTGGASPALAVRARDTIASTLGTEYARAAEWLGELRRTLPATASRRHAFAQMIDDGLVDAFRRGDVSRVESLTERARLHVLGGRAAPAEPGGSDRNEVG